MKHSSKIEEFYSLWRESEHIFKQKQEAQNILKASLQHADEILHSLHSGWQGEHVTKGLIVLGNDLKGVLQTSQVHFDLEQEVFETNQRKLHRTIEKFSEHQ